MTQLSRIGAHLRIIAALGLLLVSSLFAQPASDSSSMGRPGIPPPGNQRAEKRALKTAEKYLSYDDYRRAMPHLEEALRLNPENAQTRYVLARSLYEVGKRKRALEVLEPYAERLAKRDFDFYMRYGRILQSNYRFADAIKQYAQAQALLGNAYPNSDLQRDLDRSMRWCQNGQRYSLQNADVTLVNVGPNVNTEYPDYAPVISSDESMLLFTSRRPGNLGTLDSKGQYYEDIYFTERRGTKDWNAARNLGEGLNTNGHDAVVSLSADGQILYLFSQEKQGNLYSARFDGRRINDLKPLGGTVNTRHYEPSICVSADRKLFLFSSDRPGGQGGLDLYLIYRKPDNTFSDPINLGPEINTPEDEDAPFLHPDGQTLFFSSRGHNSVGGYDIFRSTLNADRTFGKPVNMGYPINTPDDDRYFVLAASGEHGYISSSRDEGIGDYDIYQVVFKKSPVPQVALRNEPRNTPTLPALGDLNPVVPVQAVTLIKGIVRDAVTQNPLASTLLVVDNAKGDTVSQINSYEGSGRFIVTLPAGRNYGLRVVAPGYLFYSENFPVNDSASYVEVVRTIALLPIQAGNKLVLKNIFFDSDKADLKAESQSELRQVLTLLNEKPTLRVRIIGHTDSQGPDDYNQRLSEARARSVADWLKANGISADRLETRGDGERSPIDSNDTEAGRRNNRRFELEIL
jgi:outer membrane protein OmpA-like peptidoglycan-associated protein/tetratricopeptide (TPR) repeat protein